MAFFDWEDRFSVNIAEIDGHHRKLIDLISQLHDAIESCSELATIPSVLSELDTVTSVLTELISYAEYHFGAEEKYMHEYAYPGYDQHRAEHHQFIDRVQAFKRSFEKEKSRLSIEIAEFMMQWWREHILGSDKKCGVFLNEHGVR
ncbi:MAG: bacteriohemerythrin [Planctomycetota bacterium]